MKLSIEAHGPSPREQLRNASTMPAPPESGVYGIYDRVIPPPPRVPSFLTETERPMARAR